MSRFDFFKTEVNQGTGTGRVDAPSIRLPKTPAVPVAPGPYVPTDAAQAPVARRESAFSTEPRSFVRPNLQAMAQQAPAAGTAASPRGARSSRMPVEMSAAATMERAKASAAELMAPSREALSQLSATQAPPMPAASPTRAPADLAGYWDLPSPVTQTYAAPATDGEIIARETAPEPDVAPAQEVALEEAAVTESTESTARTAGPIDIDQTLLPSEEVLTDEEAPPAVVAPRRKELSTAKLRRVEADQQAGAKIRNRAHDLGSAVASVMTSSQAIRLNEVGAPVEMLWQAHLEPTSGLREIMTDPRKKNPVDPALMTEESYALPAIWNFFMDNDILGVTEKQPVVDEASAHSRIVRPVYGPTIRTHPIVYAKWNADFDGDVMKVSFDQTAVAGAKTSMSFLIGTDGKNKIDPDAFAMAVWKGSETVESQLKKMFNTDTDNPLNLTSDEIKGLAAGIRASWEVDSGHGLRLMLRWCRSIGIRMGAEADKVTARILEDIYNLNKDIRIAEKIYEGTWRYLGPAQGALFDVNGLPMESPVLPAFEGLSSEAGNSSNMFDMWTMLGVPYGMVPKKNQQFRLGANIAKAARRRRDLFSTRESAELTQTAEDVIAKAMSGVKSLDESTVAIEREARKLVFERVGFPKFDDANGEFDPGLWKKFLDDYRREHNRVAFAFNSAAASLTLDFTITPNEEFYFPVITEGDLNSKTEVDARHELRAAFFQNYGGFTMKRLFGRHAPAGFENMTLDEYVRNNKIQIVGNRKTAFDTPENFILRLADLRTSFASDFREMLLKYKSVQDRTVVGGVFSHLMDGNRTKFLKVYKDFVDGKADMQDIIYMTEALFLLGPEMFEYLGLDSPSAWQHNELGRKFAFAKSAEQLGGIFYEAVVAYRMAPIFEAEQKIRDAKPGGQRQFYQNKLERELRALASSSATWGFLIREYQNPGTTVFSDIIFADLDMGVKDSRLNSLVRSDPLGRPNQDPYEIASDLLARPSGPHSGDRFSTDMGRANLKKHIRDSTSMLVEKKYEKQSYAHWKESVREARAAAPDQLRSFLEQVKDSPRSLVAFEPWMIVDAVLSALEKSYRSSEKTQQEGAVSYIYAIVANLINGGIFSDLNMGGDMRLGQISEKRFRESPAIIARLLTDPEFTITVYNGDGDIIMDRNVLMDRKSTDPPPTDEEIWDWLEAHPRVAMTLRQRAMTNNVSKTGYVYQTATLSLKDTMLTARNARNHPDAARKMVLSELADHPGFYAMVGLATKMTGMTRMQLRVPMTDTVGEVVDFIRELSTVPALEMSDYITKMASSAGLDTARIQKVYEHGEKQREKTPNPADGGRYDVRDTVEYQTGQILNRLSRDLGEYAGIVAAMDLPGEPRELRTPAAAAKLFKLTDESTIRSFFDTTQTMIASKTAISTSINGAESQLNAALMFFTQYLPDDCGNGVEEGMDRNEFLLNWTDYVGRRVTLTRADGSLEYVAVKGPNSVERILASSPEMVMLEDPAQCIDPICPCKRHATADASTNFDEKHLGGQAQTLALGRLLTIVRALSTEGLNLKIKTQGDDLTDSIVKTRVFDMVVHNIQDIINEEPDLASARTKLAEILRTGFEAMKYEGEITDADYVNIAHVLIHTMPEGSPYQWKVLSIGQLNARMTSALGRLRDAAGTKGLTHQEVVDEAVRSLDGAGTVTIDKEQILAGVVAVQQVNGYGLQSGLVSQRQSSFGRNYDLIKDIIAENPDVVEYTDTALDQYEVELRQAHADVFKTWKDYAGVPRKEMGSKRRYTYRIVGIVPIIGLPNTRKAVGFRNAWIIDPRNDDIRQTASSISTAYKLGLTVFLPAAPSKEVWNLVKGVGAHELVALDNTGTRFMLPMFDIRLNGGNTSPSAGAVNAGVFHGLPEHVRFIAESVLNEYSLGDAEGAATRRFVSSLRPRKIGTYSIRASVAFGNLADMIRSGELSGHGQTPTITKMSRQQVEAEILKNPNPPIDTGAIIEEGDAEDIRLQEDFATYRSRWSETNDDGFLPDARPGDMIGWIRAQYGKDVVRYHPVRVFEADNRKGAPDSFAVESYRFNNETRSFEVVWKNEGTMLGRAFKMFEYLAASNKSMMRPDAIDDIVLDNGTNIDAVIAKFSTAGRRLLMARTQKMATVMYMARISPNGYNLASMSLSFPGDQEMKDKVLTGVPTLGDFATFYGADFEADYPFFPDEKMNGFINDMVKKAVRYGIDPTVVLASQHLRDGGYVPNNMWFNFQILMEGGPEYQDRFMRFFHLMLPHLIPDGLDDTATSTLFNSDLQVLMPMKYKNRKGKVVTGKTWVNIFAGFHFMDEHYTGFSGSGLTVQTDGIPVRNTQLPGGRELTSREIDDYFDWGTIGSAKRSASSGWITSEDVDEND